jgi:hypothetical protein
VGEARDDEQVDMIADDDEEDDEGDADTIATALFVAVLGVNLESTGDAGGEAVDKDDDVEAAAIVVLEVEVEVEVEVEQVDSCCTFDT